MAPLPAIGEREGGHSRTPILALTASALEDDVRRTFEAGVDMHISKPIKKAILIAAIKNSTHSASALTIAKTLNDAAAGASCLVKSWVPHKSIAIPGHILPICQGIRATRAQLLTAWITWR